MLTARQYGEVVSPSTRGGALFAVMVQILLHSGAIAVQALSEPHIYPRLQCFLCAHEQCRGTNAN